MKEIEPQIDSAIAHKQRMKKSVINYLLIATLSALLFLPFKGLEAAGLMFIGIFVLLFAISALKKITVTDKIKAISIPEFKKFRKFFIPALLISIISFPLVLKDYYIDVLIMSGIYILLALGLNIIVGFAGLLHLGYAAFYAIGAYTYAIVNTKLNIGFWASLPLSASLAAFAGLLLAIPALRLRGDYLAIVTLGFGEIVRLVLNNWDSLTNGPNGITGIASPEIFGLSLGRLSHFYYLVLIFVIIALIIIRRIECSSIGRAWIAIKGNEIAASTLGIDTTRYKIYAFVFGSFWAGIAGILFSAKMRFISPESFTFLESILILSMVILGGLGNTYGAIIGAFILVVLPEILREVQSYRMLILGIGLVMLMIFRPQGILGRVKNVHFRSS
jgi:branched-chain amino acid transport system permease protein